jgi:hypothetical protein
MEGSMAKCLIYVSAGLLAVFAPPSQAEMIFEARPSIRVDASADTTTREKLSELAGEKNRITIVWQDGKYIWATRDARELVLRAGGATYMFLEPNGAGYVKILDTHAIPGSDKKSKPRYLFMEHVHILQSTISYWGSCDDLCFRPWVGE